MDLLAIGLALGLALTSANPAPLCDAVTLRRALESRAETDQVARAAYVRNMESREANEAVMKIDAENRAWLRPVLEQCGWPRQSAVGSVAARGAWLIAQHADMEPAFQVFAAGKMKQMVLVAEADGRRLALLVDRNRRMQKQAQVYGMQFKDEAGTIRFLPVEHPYLLDARRKELGLEPFVCWYGAIAKQNAQPVVWPDGVPRTDADCPAAP